MISFGTRVHVDRDGRYESVLGAFSGLVLDARAPSSVVPLGNVGLRADGTHLYYVDALGNLTDLLVGGGGSSGYATIQNNGSSITARTTLNLPTGSGLVAADAGGKSTLAIATAGVSNAMLANAAATLNTTSGQLTGGGTLTLGSALTLGLASVGPGAGAIGTAGVTSITLDAQGRVTAATAAALVPQTRTITAGTGLSGTGDLSADRTLSIANTAVSAGSYTNASITVDAQGRLTAASSGGASSVDGLLGAYQAASATAQNIIGLTTALGPVLVRNNATPITTTLFGIQTSDGTTTKFFDVTPGAVTWGQTVQTTGSPTMAKWSPAAHTTLTASTTAPDFDFAANRTVQFATGALTEQYSTIFRKPTYGFVAASTLTTAATVLVDGAPAAGTNATLTTTTAMWARVSGANDRSQIWERTGTGARQYGWIIDTSANLQLRDETNTRAQLILVPGANPNFGVGLNTPGANLDVNGTSTVTSRIISSTATTGTAIQRLTVPSQIWDLINDNGTGSGQLFFYDRTRTKSVWGFTAATNTQQYSNVGQQVHRTAVADTNYTVLLSDFIVAYTSLSATRTVTLPSAATAGAGALFTIKDEAGSALTNNIVIARAGSDTFEGGGTSISIVTNFGEREIYSDGVSKWFVLSSL